QTVIRENEILSMFRFCNYGFSRTAHSWVNHDNKYGSCRIIRRCAIEETGSVENGKRRDLLREIDYAKVGENRIHDSFADRNGIVDCTEVGHQDYGWRIFLRGLLHLGSSGRNQC